MAVSRRSRPRHLQLRPGHDHDGLCGRRRRADGRRGRILPDCGHDRSQHRRARDDRRFAALRTERGAGCLALAECVHIAVGGARGQPSPDRTDERRDRPGRYRWTSPGGDVTFVLPAGWTGRSTASSGATPTHLELAHYMPGSPDQVTHVYADACKSEGRLEPADPLDGNSPRCPRPSRTRPAPRPGRAGSSGPAGRTIRRAGQMVEIREEPGLDRSTCRYGADRPLRIWADPEETTFFALAPGHWGVAISSARTARRSCSVPTCGRTQPTRR